jgi:tRNA pseudouridine synthase 10
MVSSQISQRTPLRVLHRRSLIDRKREILYMSTVQLNPHYFILDLVTSAGNTANLHPLLSII